MKNIVLIGFMGTGKSSVGKALAKRLKRRWVDVDGWIEAQQRRKITEIFAQDGEAAFRLLEGEAVSKLSRTGDGVITTGGGVVLDSRNMDALRDNGIIVTLTSDPETILRRVGDAAKRPLLAGKADKLAEIRRLLGERAALYDRCDLHCDTSGATPAQAAMRIERELSDKGLL